MSSGATPGLFRHTATILRPTGSKDSLGLRADSWTESGTFRCRIDEQSAGEQGYADGVAVVRTVELRAWWRSVVNLALSEIDRVSVRGRVLRVNAVRNLDEGDRTAVIECTEVDA